MCRGCGCVRGRGSGAKGAQATAQANWPSPGLLKRNARRLIAVPPAIVRPKSWLRASPKQNSASPRWQSAIGMPQHQPLLARRRRGPNSNYPRPCSFAALVSASFRCSAINLFSLCAAASSASSAALRASSAALRSWAGVARAGATRRGGGMTMGSSPGSALTMELQPVAHNTIAAAKAR